MYNERAHLYRRTKYRKINALASIAVQTGRRAVTQMPRRTCIPTPAGLLTKLHGNVSPWTLYND